MPLVRGQSAGVMLRIGDAIARRCDARGAVLSLVEIPATWLGISTSSAARSRELLRWIAANDAEPATTARMSIQSRFTADPVSTVREALLESQSDLVVVEFPRPDAPRKHRLTAMLRGLSGVPGVGFIGVRPGRMQAGAAVADSVVVPLRGGPNAWLALSVGMAVAADAGASLTLLHVYERGRHPRFRRHEAGVFHELAEAAEEMRPAIVELFADDVPAGLMSAATGHDAVVLGAHAATGEAGILAGMVAGVVERTSATVIVARAAVVASAAA